MLTAITLENFKAFKRLPDVSIKPITVLCGTNSCGKSSILQSILLAKQTIESKQPSQTLLLNGRFVRLGMFENVIFEKNTDSDVVLDFSFCTKKETFPEMSADSVFPFRFILERLLSERCLRSPHAEYHFNFRISLAAGKRRRPRTHLRAILVKGLKFEAKAITQEHEVIDGAAIEMQLMERNRYEVVWRNVRSRDDSGKSGTVVARVRFSNLQPEQIRVVSDDKIKGRAWLQDINLSIFIFEQLLEALFSTYTYIGPLREEPSRRYIYEDEILEIGTKGENAAYISLADYDERIGNCFFYNRRTDSFRRESDPVRLGDALTKWLEVMGIHDFKPDPVNEIIYLKLKSNCSKRTIVNIADVGFGVSQVLPIVLEGLRMCEGNTLLLEQPEIHLHPNLQMQMADYFISLALSNKNVIVETHSDHIVNRLVRRVVEDEKLNLNDLIKIYFITPSTSGSKCEEVRIDPERGIVNWPDSFFDQTASEQERIVQAGLRKRKARRDTTEARQ